MSFTYSPSTDIGRVRLRIMDTRKEQAAYSDEEISALIADEGGWRAAVVAAARGLLMDRARFARVFSNPEGSVDETGGVAALQALIDQFSAQAPASLPTVTVRTLGSHPMDPFDTR